MPRFTQTLSATAIARPSPPIPQAAGSRARSFWAPVAVIALAPVIGVLVLRAPLVNALAYRDPWFYSGYGWTLSHHIEIFGWFYYSVRFPAILPIHWSTDLLGPVGGYLVLRYVILAGTGALLYACVSHWMSRWVGAASVLLLAMSPFYLRMVLWDYTTFIELPATIAAVSTWYLSTSSLRSRLLTGGAAGALVGIAVFANPAAFMVIPALYGVEIVAALRDGRSALRLILVGGVASIVGAALVFIAGWIAYRSALGSLPAYQIVKPTIDFARQGRELSAPFEVPARIWLQHEPRVYAPVVMCLALVIVAGRSLLANTTVARLGQFALAYTVFLWLYRKVATSAVIETWWAYNLTATTMCFGMPVVLHELGRRGTGLRTLVGSAVGGAAAADLIIRSAGTSAVSIYDDVRTRLLLLLAILAVAALLVTAMRAVRGPRWRAAAVAAFAALLMAISLTPAGYIGVRQTGEFSPFRGQAEVRGYDAAYRMNELIADSDRPAARTMLWSTLEGFADVGWTNLPHQQGGIDNPEAPTPAPTLTPAELDLLRYPTTRRVLVLSEVAKQIDPALAALRHHGFTDAVIEQKGTWADGSLRYALIDLKGR
jgi:hypothetical protein